MKPRKSVFLTLLVCLLCISAILWYQDHVCTLDRDKFETIITGEERFKDVYVRRLGSGVVLGGSVASTEDLNVFVQKVNAVKRGRVLMCVTVQAVQPPK